MWSKRRCLQSNSSDFIGRQIMSLYVLLPVYNRYDQFFFQIWFELRYTTLLKSIADSMRKQLPIWLHTSSLSSWLFSKKSLLTALFLRANFLRNTCILSTCFVSFLFPGGQSPVLSAWTQSISACNVIHQQPISRMITVTLNVISTIIARSYPVWTDTIKEEKYCK